jgi:hypothetical protein
MGNPRDPLRRKNHYVPASYLAAFAARGAKEGTLWAYRRDDPASPLQQRPVDAAREKDLYIRRDKDGQRSDAAERFFADQIEGPFAAVRNRLVYGASVGLTPSLNAFSEEDRLILFRFVAHQLLRTPAERDAMRWLGQLGALTTVREALAPGAQFRKLLEEARGRPLSQADLPETERLLLGLSVIKNITNDWLPRSMRAAERLTVYMRQFEWRVITVPADVHLVTSDMPVVCARRGKHIGEYELGGGWSDPTFEATLPLSPAHVVLVARYVADEDQLLTERFARSVRRRTIAAAQRWVFSRDEDPSIAQALRDSRKPSYYAEVTNDAYQVGYPMHDIAERMRSAGEDQLRFLYGVPPSR